MASKKAPMSPPELDMRFDAARQVVKDAAMNALAHFRDRKNLKIENKGLQDMVSQADRETEDIIISGLRKSFPMDGVLGEERGRQTGTSDFLWVIDPIDGTANFVRGIPFWCVSVGLLKGNDPVIGFIVNPVMDEFYSAAKGHGATLNGDRIRVSQTAAVKEARIGVGFSYRRPVATHVAAVDALLRHECEYNRLGSGALGLALTADGRLDGYWEAHINIWDVAAGLCIVGEAGGITSNFTSGAYIAQGNPILATNTLLAKPLAGLLGAAI
jgi:myo-inositol-1(or 4)-monophosphatase